MSFPVNVPNVPGVPPVIFAPGFSDIIGLLTQDAVSLFAGALSLPWGIYLGIVPVILADNVTAFSYDQKYQISDFPVEPADFESYNKVFVPFEVRLRFTAGGNLINRQAFLDSIAAIIGDINLYNIVTADAVYTGVNLTEYSYQQSAGSGLGLIAVDVTARQVKTAPAAALSNTINPSSASQVNDGPVQTAAPTASQLSAIPTIDDGV